MSVLIKGMEMPKHAAVDGEKDTVYKCAVLAHPDNTVELVIDEIFVTPYYNGHDIQRYPFTEIPIPHGRLIDAERLFNIFEPITSFPEDEQIMYVEAFLTAIKQAQTIIEAEVSE